MFASDDRATLISTPAESQDHEMPEFFSSSFAEDKARHVRTLGAKSIVIIAFFNVSGGPIGSEGIVSAGGPLLGIMMAAIFPPIFSVPQSMMTAELSSAFPSNGGYSLWVTAAFGPFWGFQESYWSWFSGVVDNALYPVLLYNTVASLYGGTSAIFPAISSCVGDDDAQDDDDGQMINLWGCAFSETGCLSQYLIKLAILALFTLPNLVRIKGLGRGLACLLIPCLLPFILMVLIGIPQVNPKFWLEIRSEVQVSRLVNIGYWLYSGFDCASTFAGEVVSPKTDYIRGLLYAVCLTTFSYVIPLAVASGVNKPNWHCWQNGSFTMIAKEIGGAWLGTSVLIGSALANWGLYVSELMEDSYQLLGMAEIGMIPNFFSKRHSTFGTPWRAIFFQVAIIAVLIGFDFTSIVTIDNFFSVASALLEFAAAIKLRITRPNLPRPYKVPCDGIFFIFFLLLPTCIGCYVLYCAFTDSHMSMIINAAGLLAGVVLHYFISFTCCTKPTNDEQFARLWMRDSSDQRSCAIYSHDASAPVSAH